MGALEALAGELACRHVTPEEVAEVKALTFEMLACHARRDLPAYYRINRLIHQCINRAARNALLTQVYSNLNQRIENLRFRSNFDQLQVGQGRARTLGDGRGARGPRRRAARRHPAASPPREVPGGARRPARGAGSAGRGGRGMNAPLARPLVFHPPGDTELARRLRGAVRGEVLFDRASRGRYSTDASIYQVEPIGVLVPADARGRARRGRRLPRARRADAAARRRQLAVRADGRRGAGHRPQQVPERRRRVRSRRDDGDGGAGHRARRAERVAQAARRLVPGRRQHVGAGDHRRHGRQQLVRLALDRLRQHGAQRRRGRRAARRRHRGVARSRRADERGAAAAAGADGRAARRSPSASATRSSARCRR